MTFWKFISKVIDHSSRPLKILAIGTLGDMLGIWPPLGHHDGETVLTEI